MRLVLDTNVVVSALLWGGNPERLIAVAGESTVELFTSVAVLACAAAARADAIVSGDADLQALARYRGIDILSPAQAIAHISPPG